MSASRYPGIARYRAIEQRKHMSKRLRDLVVGYRKNEERNIKKEIKEIQWVGPWGARESGLAFASKAPPHAIHGCPGMPRAKERTKRTDESFTYSNSLRECKRCRWRARVDTFARRDEQTDQRLYAGRRYNTCTYVETGLSILHVFPLA